MKIRYEPARVIAFVSAALALAVGYGLLDDAQSRLWASLATAVIMLAQGEITRSQVVPASKVRDAGITPEEINEAVRETDGSTPSP